MMTSPGGTTIANTNEHLDLGDPHDTPIASEWPRLLRGRIDLFSTDALIDMLAWLGVGVRLVVKPSRSREVA
jgi:hypothetical protein